MANRKGTLPGTRSNKRDSEAFPAAGAYGRARSPRRAEAMREGRSEQHTLTRAERLRRAHERDIRGPAGFHGSKRGPDVLPQRPSFSKPTRHPGRVHRGPGYHS
jgi:hypothetical protein